MQRRGFILPFVIVLSLILLTAFSFWYKQTLLQSALAKRLLEQRAYYAECRSLLPYIKGKLDAVELERLKDEKIGFLTVKRNRESIWEIDRSAWRQGKIKLTFRRVGGSEDSIELIIKYDRS